MDEGHALFQTILESPDDDAPRLIYSDWLEEQGQPERAQFIRVQIAAARTPTYSPAYRKLEAKARRLYQKAWGETLRGKVMHCELSRGFIHRVTMYSKRFVMDGDDLFATEPIQEVKFADFSSTRGNVPIDTLATCDHLKRLRAVTFVGSILDGRVLWALFSGQQLNHIEALALENVRFDQGYPSVLDRGRLPHLRELHVQMWPTQNDGWNEMLLSASVIPQLKRFTLIDYANSREQDIPLAEVPFQQLEKLTIRNATSSRLLRIIADSPQYQQLVDLDLSMCEISDDDLIALCENPQFNKLRRLNLPLNRITGRGVQALLQAEHLRGLYVLNLDGSHITGKSGWKKKLREWCPEAIIRLL